VGGSLTVNLALVWHFLFLPLSHAIGFEGWLVWRWLSAASELEPFRWPRGTVALGCWVGCLAVLGWEKALPSNRPFRAVICRDYLVFARGIYP